MKKLLYFCLILMFLVGFQCVLGYEINTFTDNTQSYQINYTNSSTYLRYLKIPRYVNATSIFISLNGSAYFNNSITKALKTLPEKNINGSYIDGACLPSFPGLYPDTLYTYMFDNDYTTYGCLDNYPVTNGELFYIQYNYSYIVKNAYLNILYGEHGTNRVSNRTRQLHKDCLSTDKIKLKIKLSYYGGVYNGVGGQDLLNLSCYNYSNDQYYKFDSFPLGSSSWYYKVWELKTYTNDSGYKCTQKNATSRQFTEYRQCGVTYDSTFNRSTTTAVHYSQINNYYNFTVPPYFREINGYSLTFKYQYNGKTNLSVLNVKPFINASRLSVKTNLRQVDDGSELFNISFYNFSSGLWQNFRNITTCCTPSNADYFIGNFTVYANKTELYNFSLGIGQSKVFNQTFFNTSNTTKNTASSLNSILRQGCVCTGCSITSSFCLVPYSYIALAAGYATYYDLAVDYNYTMRIHVRNETNKKLLLNKNAFVEFISPSYKTNRTTNTGNFTLNLIPDDYTVRYRATGFPEKFYYFTLDNSTPNTLDLYLLNTTQTQTGGEAAAQEVTATVYDELGNIVQDAYISVLRYNPDTNTYVNVGIYRTNNNGITKMYLILNTEFYQFIVYYPYGEVNTITSPSYVYSNSIYFRVQITTDPLQEYNERLGITTDLTFNNATNNFRWTYTDLSNISSNYCLYVYRYVNAYQSLYNSSCQTSHTGTILVGITPLNGSTFVGKGVITQSGQDYEIDQASVSYPSDSVFGDSLDNKKMGLFIVTVLVIVFIFITRDMIISMFLSGLPFALGIYTGMMPGFEYYHVLYYYIVVLIISFVIWRFR